jgi:pyruvate dehydrogenase E1 component beta subunit
MRPGRDVTIVALSYMTIESMRAAAILEEEGLSAEVVDVRTLRPLDTATILDSVRRTGRLLVADPGIKFAGFGAEVSALAAEEIFVQLRCAPRRIACPDYPVPASPALAAEYYPRAVHVAAAVRRMMERSPRDVEEQSTVPLDVPDATFRGPF